MDNQRAQNTYSPPPYTPYPNAPAYPVQAPYPPGQYPNAPQLSDPGSQFPDQPAQNPDYIEYNGDTTYAAIDNPIAKKQQQNTGLEPAQIGYNPVQPGYPINGQTCAYNSTNQQPTTVYIQAVVVPLDNPPPNYLVQSILTFIFCCWIFGLVAIMKSVASDSAAKTGRREEAEKESAQARKWNITGLVVGIVIWVCGIVTFSVLIAIDIDD